MSSCSSSSYNKLLLSIAMKKKKIKNVYTYRVEYLYTLIYLCVYIIIAYMHHNYVTYIVAIMADLTAALSANVAIYE